MRVFNTLTRRLEEFEPIEPRHVRMYTCGPTVYNFAHLGNFRAYVFEDLLRRTFLYAGFRVTQVMNLTDVDDKTIKGSAAAGLPLAEYTRKYKDAFFEDLLALNIQRAEHYPEATAHIPEMIALIQRLIDKGFAYKSDDGSVYFSISRFPGYGKLARVDLSGLKPGARVNHDEYEKENLADFALWKAWDEGDGEVAWDSPWGRGRPGWHIECSAMSMKYLGESFDVHTGGIDNIFPHHEDEIAQSEAATGRQFARYWMHCAHLIVDGRKMAKSLGNFFTLRDVAARGYSGRETRYVLISAHYRQTLNFTFDALDAARSALARVDEFRERLAARKGRGGDRTPPWAEQSISRFREAVFEDLGIPDAMASLFDLVRDGNRALDAGEDFDAESVLSVLDEMDRVLGVLQPAAGGGHGDPDSAVKALVNERETARKAKRWAEADRLRRAILDMGWEVRDTPSGPRLSRIQR